MRIKGKRRDEGNREIGEDVRSEEVNRKEEGANKEASE